MFNRIEAKFAAKDSMRGARPNPMLVTLVFLLLTAGISWVIPRLLGDPAVEAMEYLMMGYEPEDIFNYVVLRAPGHIAVFAAVSLLLDLYGAIMSFGYTSYALRLSRGERPGYANLFDGFALAGRVLWTDILIAVFTNLWSLLGAVPGVALLIMGIVGESLEAVMAGYFAMAAGIAAVGIIVSLRYRLAFYFLLDDPDCTARASITRSKRAMRGWKMELFTLDLSFLGWILLTGVTAGIAAVWVVPYMDVTEAIFYAAATGNSGTRPSQPPQGGHQGPYDYRNDNDINGGGPAPF